LADFLSGGCRTHSLRIDSDMLVVTASPARTALKISQLTDGGMTIICETVHWSPKGIFVELSFPFTIIHGSVNECRAELGPMSVWRHLFACRTNEKTNAARCAR
jgi:hypothetical protein